MRQGEMFYVAFIVALVVVAVLEGLSVPAVPESQRGWQWFFSVGTIALLFVATVYSNAPEHIARASRCWCLGLGLLFAGTAWFIHPEVRLDRLVGLASERQHKYENAKDWPRLQQEPSGRAELLEYEREAQLAEIALRFEFRIRAASPTWEHWERKQSQVLAGVAVTWFLCAIASWFRRVKKEGDPSALAKKFPGSF